MVGSLSSTVRSLRFILIPRALAALGLIGIALQFTGVTLMMFLGYKVIGEMAMPMLPIQIAVAVWLMVRGFEERHRQNNNEEQVVGLNGA